MNFGDMSLESLESIKKEVNEAIDAKKNTYYVGQRFKVAGSKYILARVDVDTVNLISLSSGNRYSEPIKVSNSTRVTTLELKKLVGSCSITLIEGE